MLIKSFQKVILKFFLKSSSVNVFSDIFCKNMVHLLSTLKRIKFKINILSGLPSIIVSVQCIQFE